MKLSEMTTGQAADAYCAMAPFIDHILRGKAAKAIFADMEQARASKENRDWIAFLLTKAVVYLIGHDHRADVYGIISAMTGKTAEQIESQKITATIADVQEFADKDFRDFLAQSLAGGRSA